MSLSGWNITTKKLDETWNDYEYKILEKESGSGSFDLDRSEWPMTYICQYTSVPLLVSDLMGWAEFTGGAVLHRVLPEVHPLYPTLYCSSASPKGIGTVTMDGKTPMWNKAHVRAVFRNSLYAILEDGEVTTEMDRYVWREGRSRVDYLTVNGAMVFEQTLRPLATTPGIKVFSKEIKLHWIQVPADPEDPYTDPMDLVTTGLLGLVNETEFLGYKKGCVLFADVDPQIAPAKFDGDSLQYNYTYTFLVRDQGDSSLYSGERIGHNFVYDQAKNRWDKVKNPASGAYTYQTGELNDLFDVTA